MSVRAYEGYFIDGNFYSAGQVVTIPERQLVYITIIEEQTTENESLAWKEFLSEIKKIDDEPLKEFERIKFREIEI